MSEDVNLKMGEFVIMPNHFHAIIGIGENTYNDKPYSKGKKNQFDPQSKNMASIVRGFKSAVTMDARKIKPEFQWQSGYYDHVIQNRISLEKISKYIKNNPATWNDDDFNK
jgi:REP element-mobilizing transposase RayT